jgi:hypothetical protein
VHASLVSSPFPLRPSSDRFSPSFSHLFSSSKLHLKHGLKQQKQQQQTAVITRQEQGMKKMILNNKQYTLYGALVVLLMENVHAIIFHGAETSGTHLSPLCNLNPSLQPFHPPIMPVPLFSALFTQGRNKKLTGC